MGLCFFYEHATRQYRPVLALTCPTRRAAELSFISSQAALPEKARAIGSMVSSSRSSMKSLATSRRPSDRRRPSASSRMLPNVVQMSLLQAKVSGKILARSEEHTSELQSLMRISFAVLCLNKKTNEHKHTQV